MKIKFTLLILLVFGVLGIAQISQAAVFFQTDWDNGISPSGWPCKNAPNSACSDTDSFYNWTSPLGGYCNDNSTKDSWAVCGRSSDYAHSGNYSFRMHRDTDISDTCDIQHVFNTPYPTVVYVRFYLYLPASMQAYNTPASEQPFTHFLFTNSARSGTGFRINWLSGVPWTSPWQCGRGYGNIPSTEPYMFFNVEMNNTQWTTGAPSPCYNLIDPANVNRWQAVEFKLDAVAKTYSVWIDGVQYVNNATGPFSQSNFTMLQFSGFESESPNGYMLDYYIDDIVVADSYIGPMGASPDTTPPAPPSGVSII